MAIPLTTQVFNAFLGTNEGTNVLLLPDAFSSEGSVNVWMDKFGRVRSWGGYSALAGVPEHGNAFVGLFATSVDEGGPWPWPTLPTRLLGYTRPWSGISTDEYLVYSADLGATWTTITHASGLGQIPDFAQLGNVVYITTSFGNYAYNDTGNGTTHLITNTQSPTPSVSESSTGLLNGTYKYKLVSINATTGARKLASAASTLLTTTNKQLSLSWTADADTAQGGYELYRTTGTGNLYYFVTYIDGRTTVAYTDNAADSAIFQNRVLEEHGDAPPTGCHYVEGHKGRLWWGPTTTHFNRLWWSDPQLPTSVLDTNYIDFSDVDAAMTPIVGMIGSFRDTLVVFTAQNVWTVSGTGSVIGYVADWNRVRSNARIGSVSGRSVVRVPAGARYGDELGSSATTTSPTLAYWTPNADIRLFDGENDVIISTPLQTTLSGVNSAAAALIHAVHDAERNHFIWFFPSGSSTFCDTAVVWNYKWGTWYTWMNLDAASACVLYDYANSPKVLVGRGNLGSSDTTPLGRVYELDESGSANGTAIVSVWRSKPLYGSDENGVPLLSQTKRWRWADLRFDFGITVSTSTVQVSVVDEFSQGLGSTTYGNPSGITGAAVPVQAKIRCQSRSTLNQNTFTDYVTSPAIVLSVSSLTDGIGTNKGWALDGFALTYQVLPGQKRRFD